MDINLFAKFDEIPSLPVQDIKEKTKCRGQRAILLTELVPSPYFSIINVHLVDINVFAKFDEIPSLPLQDIEKPKRRGRMEGQTNGWTDNVETVYPPQTVCEGGGGV